MKKFYKFGLYSFISIASSVSLAGEVSNTTITKLMIDTNHGDKVFIKTEKEPTARPTCHSSSWSFVLPLDNELYKNMYSMLLAAQTAGKSIELKGRNQTCSVHEGIETLRRIEYEWVITKTSNRSRYRSSVYVGVQAVGK